MAGQRPAPAHAGADAPALTVNELILAFWRRAEQHYRREDGTPTSELNDYRLSLRPLRELYGPTPAADFSPLKLKAVRQRMIDAGLCRGVVNQRVGRIVRMFKWAVVRGDRPGRRLARPDHRPRPGEGPHRGPRDGAGPARRRTPSLTPSLPFVLPPVARHDPAAAPHRRPAGRGLRHAGL